MYNEKGRCGPLILLSTAHQSLHTFRNQIMDLLPGMVIIIPKTAQPIGINAGVIWCAVRRRIVQDSIEGRSRVIDPSLDFGITALESRQVVGNQVVIRHNSGCDRGLVCRRIREIKGSSLDWRYREEDEISSSGVVENLDLAEVAGDDLRG